MTPGARRVLLAVIGLAVLAAACPAAAQLTEADVFVAEGILAIEDKRYEEALGHFRRALEREPDHIEALYYSGVALMAQGKASDAVELLERAREKSPTEPSVAFQLGLAYVTLKRHDRAEPLLEEVFGREPTLDSLGYYVGYLRYRRGRYRAALEAFRAGRTTDPDIGQLTRFYAGLSLAALGLPGQAAAEVEQAIRLQPASPLTGPAERLRATFAQARTRERRFRADVRVGFYYDDNASIRPDLKPSDATVTALREGRSDTIGELGSLRLEYDVLREGPWLGSVGYSFFVTQNNDLPKFNIIDHLGSVTLTRQGLLGEMPLYTGGQYAYEFLMLDEDDLLRRHSIALFSTLVESPRHLTSGLFRVDVKAYSEGRPLPSEEFQDGENFLVGLLHVLRFSEDRHFLRGGYQIDVEDTEGSNLRYVGHRFLLGAQYTLPWEGIRLIYDFDLHVRDYRHKHTLFPEDEPDTVARFDHEYTHVLRAEWPLSGNFTLGLAYQATILRSNLAVFTYRRNVTTLSLSWQY